MPETSPVTTMEVMVDMVVYPDRTAEVTNERAFNRIIASRKAEAVALQKTNQVIQQALRDPKDAPSTAAVLELKRLADVSHNRNTAPDDLNGHLAPSFEAAASDLRAAPRIATALNVSETEYLKTNIAGREERITALPSHAQITKEVK